MFSVIICSQNQIQIGTRLICESYVSDHERSTSRSGNHKTAQAFAGIHREQFLGWVYHDNILQALFIYIDSF